MLPQFSQQVYEKINALHRDAVSLWKEHYPTAPELKFINKETEMPTGDIVIGVHFSEVYEIDKTPTTEPELLPIRYIPEYFALVLNRGKIFKFCTSNQVYLVSSSKVREATTPSPSKTPFYLIEASRYDRQLDKSPLIPLSCKNKNINLNTDTIDNLTFFVISKVARNLDLYNPTLSEAA